jgi:hypothetical protein
MGCGSSSAAGAPSVGRRGPASRGADAQGLQPVPSWTTDERLTSSQLAAKREAFWSSQSSGAPVVWSNLRVAADALLAGDLELAAAVLDAADIVVPQAELSLTYDASGRSYQLPRWVYSSPSNLLSDADYARLQQSSRRDHVGAVTDLSIMCRISASGDMLEQDIKLQIKSNTTVAELKARLHALLLTGDADQKADANSSGRPNVWRDVGLAPARQRVMYRRVSYSL